uniref:Integrase catalytic domain-containing protein n=1 Tax=Strongyloides venezuelensis TaxID=75913 RepID=A0A0K0FJT1_STRVS
MLRSDNGSAFIAKPVTDCLTSIEVEQQFSSSHNYTSNAIPLSTITTHFTYVYNRSKNASTEDTSAQILLNTSDRTTNQIPMHNGFSGIHHFIKDTKEQFHKPDLKRYGLKLKIGDLVLRKIRHRKDAATLANN